MNLYTQISKNNRESFFLVLFFPATLFALVLLVFFLADLFGEIPLENAWQNALSITLSISPFLLGGGLLWMIIAYFFGGNMILKSAKSKEIHKKDFPKIYRIVENLSITAGLPTPKIYIINDSSLNAFATGRDPNHAAIALTTGIIKKLNKQELEGVIAHELAHIGNRDIRLMILIVIGLGFFSFVGEVLMRSAGRSSGRSSSKKGNAAAILFLLGLALIIFSYVIAPLLKLAISRKREYLADATGAMLTRHPEALASALEKISKDSRVESLDSRPTAAAICIENPFEPSEESEEKKGFFSKIKGLFSTHPPTNERIRLLREF